MSAAAVRGGTPIGLSAASRAAPLVAVAAGPLEQAGTVRERRPLLGL